MADYDGQSLANAGAAAISPMRSTAHLFAKNAYMAKSSGFLSDAVKQKEATFMSPYRTKWKSTDLGVDYQNRSHATTFAATGVIESHTGNPYTRHPVTGTWFK